MDKKQKIASKIYDTYTERLADLPSKERIHFARRAYRATGDTYFGDIMKEWALRHTVPGIKKGSVVVQGVVDKNKAYPKVRIKDNSTNPRNIKRKAVLEEKPEIQFYRRYLMNLFQAHLMEVQKTHLSNDWEGFISYLKKIDFEKVLMNEKAIFGVSSFSVNCAYFVSHLGVDEEFSHKFVAYLKDLYFNSDGTLKVELDKYEFITLIYNLTHIIIAESKFYQERVVNQLWINEFLSENIDKILEYCGIDVIAEVGMCFKLACQQKTYAGAVQKIDSHIMKKYNLKTRLSDKFLVKGEHTNCLIMLLFMDIEHWHSGPYFS